MGDIEFSWRSLLCSPDIRSCPFEIAAFKIDPLRVNRHIYRQAIQAAKQQGGTTLAPDGSKRCGEGLFNTRYLGALSEIALVSFLRQQLGGCFGVNRDENFRGYDQHVDIVVTGRGMRCMLEVRGSFPYAPLERVVCELFNILGPYSTSYKLYEWPKDFYLCTLINEPRGAFDVSRPHTLYFPGGAKYSLFREKGRQDSLKQCGARYLDIKPIARARDAREIIKLIRAWFAGA